MTKRPSERALAAARLARKLAREAHRGMAARNHHHGKRGYSRKLKHKARPTH